MSELFSLCRRNDWDQVLKLVQEDPCLGVTLMTMDNHIQTTLLHQAITSKGDVEARAKVVEYVLEHTPSAASIKNGYGSLPLHVIAQRNTRITSSVKEKLIVKMIEAYDQALVEEGGTGRRTPLHIIFTDYVAPRLVSMMIERGPSACFKRDKKGWLPAHVACSRHCSPDKLRMLLQVNPDSLHSRTADGKSLLELATRSATKSHPNYALIDELRRQLDQNQSGPRVPQIAPQVHQDRHVLQAQHPSRFHGLPDGLQATQNFDEIRRLDPPGFPIEVSCPPYRQNLPEGIGPSYCYHNPDIFLRYSCHQYCPPDCNTNSSMISKGNYTVTRAEESSHGNHAYSNSSGNETQWQNPGQLRSPSSGHSFHWSYEQQDAYNIVTPPVNRKRKYSFEPLISTDVNESNQEGVAALLMLSRDQAEPSDCTRQSPVPGSCGIRPAETPRLRARENSAMTQDSSLSLLNEHGLPIEIVQL